MGVVPRVYSPRVTWPCIWLTRWVAGVRRARLGVGGRVRWGLRVPLWGRGRSWVMTWPELHGVVSWIQWTSSGEENGTILKPTLSFIYLTILKLVLCGIGKKINSSLVHSFDQSTKRKTANGWVVKKLVWKRWHWLNPKYNFHLTDCDYTYCVVNERKLSAFCYYFHIVLHKQLKQDRYINL